MEYIGIFFHILKDAELCQFSRKIRLELMRMINGRIRKVRTIPYAKTIVDRRALQTRCMIATILEGFKIEKELIYNRKISTYNKLEGGSKS